MTTSLDKMVFISYRRSTSKAYARLIFDRLRAAGFDAFLDVSTIDSGTFDSVILSQIGARPHFVVLISHGSLKRCQNEGDWLRREIEEAIRLGRNIVPVIEEGVNFTKETEYLPTHLREDFRRYNGLPLVYFYFDATMDMLMNRFLKQPVHGIRINTPPLAEQQEVQKRIEQVAASPTPTLEELNAKLYLNLGHMKHKVRNLDGAIADYSKAIYLKPNYVEAYLARGNVYYQRRDYNAAVKDANEAINFDPNLSLAYSNRGEAYFAQEQYSLALENYEKAQKLKRKNKYVAPGLAVTLHALGEVSWALSIWKLLLEQNEKFRDIEWVRKEFNWAEPLVEEAKKLIAKL
jgi:tetratricopeptide (TPR) repeat protein